MGLLTSGVITERQAGEQLNLSIRQVRRLKGRFIEGGKTIDSLVFYRQHQQVNKVPYSIREKVIFLKKEGMHRSCQHIVEILPGILNKEEKVKEIRKQTNYGRRRISYFLWKEEGIKMSESTIGKILRRNNLSKKKKRRKVFYPAIWVYDQKDPFMLAVRWSGLSRPLFSI